MIVKKINKIVSQHIECFFDQIGQLNDILKWSVVE